MNWRYRDTVLLLCMFAFFVTYFARLVVSPVVPFIVDDFVVSNTQIGIALSGMWIAYGVTQFPSGVLAERYGEKRVIAIALGGTAIVSLLTAMAPLFVVFAACVVLLGGVAGLHYSVATTLLSRTYDDIGTALGLHSFGAPLAGLLAPVTASWVGVRFGWRPAVALASLVAVPTLALFSWRVRATEPRHPGRPMRERFAVAPLVGYLSRPPITFTIAIAIIATFAVNGIVAFLPTFLVEHRAYSPTLAGVVFSAYFVVRGGTQIGVGVLSDRIGRDFAIATCLFSGAGGLALFVAGPGLVAVAAAVLLFGVGSSFFASLEPRFMDVLSDAERGAGFGLVRTIYLAVGSTGSFGASLLADLFGWGVSFGVLAVLCLFAFGCIVTNAALNLGY
ncbi:MFS transporter [Halomarina halobia]|uniref:MFS transporter n=1 Tax=Halomarina halobia TaxID=3033386 RepID=A0ABD6AES5_9EURY|nr:MFS transporter [Halomarina sp. PSR21]